MNRLKHSIDQIRIILIDAHFFLARIQCVCAPISLLMDIWLGFFSHSLVFHHPSYLNCTVNAFGQIITNPMRTSIHLTKPQRPTIKDKSKVIHQ